MAIDLGHVLRQIKGKGVFCHPEVVDAPVGLDEILFPAKVVAPKPTKVRRVGLEFGQGRRSIQRCLEPLSPAQ